MGGSPLLHDAQFVWAVHDVLGLPTAQYLVAEPPSGAAAQTHVFVVPVFVFAPHFILVLAPQLAPAATQVPVGVAQWALLTHVRHVAPSEPEHSAQVLWQAVHAYAYVSVVVPVELSVLVTEAFLQYCLLSVPQLASTAKQALERRQGWVSAHAVHSKSFEFSSYPHAAQLATVVLHDVQ